MLVLQRKVDQRIFIGDGNGAPDIEIVVVEVRDNKVRLGIRAPREVIVHREEIWLAIEAERNGRQPTTRTEGPA